MKRVMIALLAATFLLAGARTDADAQKTKKGAGPMYTPSAVTLKMDMRKLWEDHISWTSTYIMAAVAGLDDTGKIAERLLKNQQDIGNAIKPIYGDAAGNKLAALLKDHILIAADLVGAAKVGDNDKAAAAEKKWYANADEIAAFLSGANPNWPQKTLESMMYAHLALTKNEAVARIKKDPAAYVDARDKGHAHILMMSDTLSDGIIKQYPKKFMK
jgi:hypothetical protein